MSGFPSRPPPRPSSVLPNANFPSQPPPRPQQMTEPQAFPSVPVRPVNIPHAVQNKPLPKPGQLNATEPAFPSVPNTLPQFPSVPQQKPMPVPHSAPRLPLAPSIPQRPSQPPIPSRPTEAPVMENLPPVPRRPSEHPGALVARSQTVPIQRNTRIEKVQNSDSVAAPPSPNRWKIEPLSMFMT